jgi:hypothetical protein
MFCNDHQDYINNGHIKNNDRRFKEETINHCPEASLSSVQEYPKEVSAELVSDVKTCSMPLFEAGGTKVHDASQNCGRKLVQQKRGPKQNATLLHLQYNI